MRAEAFASFPDRGTESASIQPNQCCHCSCTFSQVLRQSRASSLLPACYESCRTSGESKRGADDEASRHSSPWSVAKSYDLVWARPQNSLVWLHSQPLIEFDEEGKGKTRNNAKNQKHKLYHRGWILQGRLSHCPSLLVVLQGMQWL